MEWRSEHIEILRRGDVRPVQDRGCGGLWALGKGVREDGSEVGGQRARRVSVRLAGC
jgi:hypothetical protein